MPGVDLETLLEAAPDLEAARRLIAELHARMQTLQQNSDALRAEAAFLKRVGGGGASVAQLQRARGELRDLRQFARKRALDGDVLAILAANGEAIHAPALAAIDQTLHLDTTPNRGVRELRPMFMTPTTRLGDVIAITSTFRIGALNGLAARYSEALDWRDATQLGGLGLAATERVEAICALDEFDPPPYLLVVTARGWCRALPWSVVEHVLASGQAITPAERSPSDRGDVPVWMGPVRGDDVLLLTRLGRWGRFPLRALASAGVHALVLDPDDDVAAAVELDSADSASEAGAVQFVGGDGSQFAVAAAGLPAHKKPGAKAQLLLRNFVALACAPHRKTGAVAMLTMTGDIVVSTTRGLQIADKPHEARPLNVVNARVAAAAFI